MSEADHRQQEELEAERLTRILEAIGHLEAAGHLAEAAAIRFDFGQPLESRPVPEIDETRAHF